MLTDERIAEIAELYTPILAPLPFVRAIEREARREALEQAARVCDERRGPIEIYNHGYPAMLECAAAIRALIDKEPRT